MRITKHPKFDEFLANIKDPAVLAKIIARVARLQMGNVGDSAPVGEGVSEMRIHVGAGWRVYYRQVGDQIILLLAGGTKSTQQADIRDAISRAEEFKKSKVIKSP